MTNTALRYNKGKPKYSLIDLTCLESCAKVLEYGANKYTTRDEKGDILQDGRDNWKKGLPVTEIIDSLLRHLGALRSGELIDPESCISHIGHIQCNALFLGNKNNILDIDVKGTDIKGTNKELLGSLISRGEKENPFIHSVRKGRWEIGGIGLCPYEAHLQTRGESDESS